MTDAAPRARAALRSAALQTQPAEATARGAMQSAGGSFDGTAEFARALPSLRRARCARHVIGDGGEDADAGATLDDATGVARGGEQALDGGRFGTHAALSTTSELPNAGGGRGGRQRRTVPMPSGAQRYKGVAWSNIFPGNWRAQHKVSGICTCKAFPADQAAAAARAYDDAVRAHGGTVVNFPRLGTAETQAQPGEAVRRPGSTPFKGVCKTVSNTFQANAKQSGRTKFLGKFATAEEAARAYDRCMREQGSTADTLNFPDEAGDAAAAGSAEAPGGKRKRAALAAASSDADDEDAGEEQDSTRAAPSAAESAPPLPDAPPASAASDAELASPQAHFAALEAQVAALQSSRAAQLAAEQARSADLQARNADLEASVAALQCETRSAVHKAHNAAAEAAELRHMKLECAKGAQAAAATAEHAMQASVAAQQRAERAERDASHHARNAAAEQRRVADVKDESVKEAKATAAAAVKAAAAAEGALEEATECRVCRDCRRDTLFFQCGHLFCGTCGPQMERCPFGCCVIRDRSSAWKSLRIKYHPRLPVPQRVF
jgi:hypothetical protein